MSIDLEMNALSRKTLPLDTSTEQTLDKTTAEHSVEIPFVANGTPRSNIRMFAILTALFVRQIPPVSTISMQKLIILALSLRSSLRRNNRRNRCSYHVP